MLYVIGGASGAGKTTLVPVLNRMWPAMQWHDFDSRWPAGTHRERQQLTQEWTVSALAHPSGFGLAAEAAAVRVLHAFGLGPVLSPPR